ncbi:hypothetical protein CANCADRAFT_2819 [Tortispora caseinolytica NRRL Y-17796]|uniref:COP9 signalosome complex subunit 2 n=1 Tax=Tortispora caseinolytica NRRL Y-17796 TaxID=767744 RepID=A0A1E4TH63_9ASCO|nr:hypothetical protein CANCADRAFT_2819 [Tortispora caseinolytica NRRL Y-17796]
MDTDDDWNDDDMNYEYDEDAFYDEDDEDDDQSRIANSYYEAKQARQTDSNEAIDKFKSVESMDNVEFKFKATKQLMKLQFKLDLERDLLDTLKSLLLLSKNTTLQRQYVEKSVLNALAYISSSSNLDFVRRAHSQTMDAVDPGSRLWLQTGLRLAALFNESHNYAEMEPLLNAIRTHVSGSGLGAFEIDFYALSIQYFLSRHNYSEANTAYVKAKAIQSAIPHPKSMAIIHECGAKMFMHEHSWTNARTAFFAAFQNYDNIGSSRRVNMLGCFILASLLSDDAESIGTFDSSEARPYRNEPELLPLIQIATAYAERNMSELNAVLSQNADTLKDVSLMTSSIVKKLASVIILEKLETERTCDIDVLAQHTMLPVQQILLLAEDLIVSETVSALISLDTRQIQLVGAADEIGHRLSAMQAWTEACRHALVS